jgi:glycosyltransferase involved in cell wall biosynthesis
VEDIRPYVRYATISIASLRIARGIQNKVLEAMALARPVVCTPQALEGIGAVPGADLALAESAMDFADTVLDLLATPARAEVMGEQARTRVIEAYGWPAQMAVLDAIIDQLLPTAPNTAQSSTQETAA